MLLPQAYVNDFGEAASPAACVEGAAEFFPASSVHPTIGVYTGQEGAPSSDRYAALLDEAGTVGFSVYLAETRMYARDWNTFGKAIAELKIASVTSDEQVDDDRPSHAHSHALIEGDCRRLPIASREGRLVRVAAP